MALTSPEGVLHLVARLSAVGVCLESLEHLSHGFRRRAADRGGGEAPPLERAVRWGTWDWHVGLPLLAAGRLALGALLLTGVDVGLSWKLETAALLVVSLPVYTLLPFTRGADSQLNAITFSAISLTLLSDTPTAASYCLYFLTLQLCLAYFAAGSHKLRSPDWRRGSALAGILSTRLFGSPRLAAWLGRHRRLARASALAVVAWEVSFPAVLVAPREIALGYFACGVLFHVATAFTMGLNKFLWAFLAVYPAAIYCTLGPLPVAP
jgi:hypothetical protein